MKTAQARASVETLRDVQNDKGLKTKAEKDRRIRKKYLAIFKTWKCILILSKPSINLAADSYLWMTCPPLPSFSAQPVLKPPWNLSEIGVY